MSKYRKPAKPPRHKRRGMIRLGEAATGGPNGRKTRWKPRPRPDEVIQHFTEKLQDLATEMETQRTAVQSLFDATPEELGKAAVAAVESDNQ